MGGGLIWLPHCLVQAEGRDASRPRLIEQGADFDGFDPGEDRGGLWGPASVVSARASAYADSAARWTTDVKAVLDATLQALVIQMQQGVLGGIGTGLGCPPVVEG